MGWLPGASSHTAASIQHWQLPKHTGKPLKFERTPLGTSFLGLPPILPETEGNKILTEPSKLSGKGGGGGRVAHHGADHCWGPRAQVYQVVLRHLTENLPGHRGEQQRSHERITGARGGWLQGSPGRYSQEGSVYTSPHPLKPLFRCSFFPWLWRLG